jgi:hypothetical protein
MRLSDSAGGRKPAPSVSRSTLCARQKKCEIKFKIMKGIINEKINRYIVIRVVCYYK